MLPFHTVHMKKSVLFIVTFLMVFTSFAMDTSITEDNKEEHEHKAIVEIMDYCKVDDYEAIKELLGQINTYYTHFMANTTTALSRGNEKTETSHLGWYETTDKIKVIKYNTALVGFIAYSFIWNTGTLNSNGDVNMICIDQEYRLKGLGSKLLNSAIEDLKQTKTIKLAVYDYDKAACKFFERAQFKREQVIGTRVTYIMPYDVLHPHFKDKSNELK